jgi:hypothetical protein
VEPVEFDRIHHQAIVNLFVGCDKRSRFRDGVPARTIIEVRRRSRSSQISAPAHREPVQPACHTLRPIDSQSLSRMAVNLFVGCDKAEQISRRCACAGDY